MVKKKHPKDWVVDKILLIVSGLVVFIVITAISFSLLFGKIISENRFTFLFSALGYSAFVFFIAFEMRIIKVYRPRWIPLLVLLLLIVLPVVVLFLLFDLVIKSFPSFGYIIGGVVLNTLTLVFFEIILEWLCKRGFIEKNTAKPETLITHHRNI